ncbi:GNAT family N-acetyltransferase [Formosa haliotis]|uniref:GNAT family N-acetyltransferase n=1 Tax=Formosa haliotis TaxID=1555194 RepID=UPI000A673579|nr:GNAT family N-acetyltransferase [Formosa haliotis]
MIHIKRTTSENPDFIELVKQLDADLAVRDGEDHAFYAQFNGIATLNHVIVAYHDKQPVSCGAIKPFNTDTLEVKRMYTLPDYRGEGLASKVLAELELWGKTMHYNYCILETGMKQPEAIALYKKNGYQSIQNYGQYIGVENSVCFKKTLE